MKLKTFLLATIAIGLFACQNNTKKKSQTSLKIESDTTVKKSNDSIIAKENPFSLALSANAIQIINQTNGSTNEIGFKMPLKQTIETIEKVLGSKPVITINSEFGAGPLKMATWDNGLTLLFQEKSKNSWLFVGWAASVIKNQKSKLNTMSGIGVGSTRNDIKSAYVIKENKTILGYEFSTKSNDLFGIFDGSDGTSLITNLWSGVSCNFR
jgi:hypothetical protein